MITMFFLIPCAAGILALLIPNDICRRVLLAVTAALHTSLTLCAWIFRPAPAWNGWCALDELSLLFLSITSLLFLAAAWYAIGYLHREDHRAHPDFTSHELFTDEPERVFTCCLLMFLSTMSLVAVSRHFGLLWIAMEATTLASAPLIYFHRQRRSLEATWKYLLICSVGIALALIGILFLAVSALQPGHNAVSLLIDTLTNGTIQLHSQWLKAAFLFILVGYGTKMGLAPLHTWLPDAHSEAPSVVSALLSGALLNCAFLGIMRIYQVCLAHGLGQFCRPLFLLFGLLSMAFAAVFILTQKDYKRMLAYSSIEHMGILALGVGIGGGAVFGAMLHAVCHSCTKAALFFTAGTIMTAYKSKTIDQVRGLIGFMPLTAILWIAGFIAITGMPPFGTFISEFSILKAAFGQGHYVIASAFLFLLALIFIGMTQRVFSMSLGLPPHTDSNPARREPTSALLPAAALLLVALIPGIYLPCLITDTLARIATMLGGY